MVWTYAGDALWVVALSIMFSASTKASSRTAGEAKVPMLGTPMPRTLALWSLPGGAFAISLWMAFHARTADLDGDAAFILFGLRATLASVLALIHLRLLEGLVKPPGRK